MLAISFSTRSSTERNGSLHSTVRWAWSLSFRCTQSTVKSRRRSCARRMNSPRSFARVVHLAPFDEVLGPTEVLLLDLEGGGLPAVGEPHLAPAGHVVADLADGPDRVLQRQVTQDRTGLHHAQHQVRGADLEHGRGLA